MSSASGKTPGGRVARRSSGCETVGQLGHSSASVVVEPGQLRGPRARTRIRSGAATTRRRLVADISIGMDVSKATVVVAVHPSDETWTSDTTASMIDALVKRLAGLGPRIVVVEATGGYERALVASCAAAGLPITVVNPRQVRAYAQAIGRTAKTDTIDARLLAEFGARVQ